MVQIRYLSGPGVGELLFVREGVTYCKEHFLCVNLFPFIFTNKGEISGLELQKKYSYRRKHTEKSLNIVNVSANYG